MTTTLWHNNHNIKVKSQDMVTIKHFLVNWVKSECFTFFAVVHYDEYFDKYTYAHMLTPFRFSYFVGWEEVSWSDLKTQFHKYTIDLYKYKDFPLFLDQMKTTYMIIVRHEF